MNSLTSRHVSIPTPGARVIVRDAEWIVRRVDHAPGGYQIVCDGVSELVRGREAVFLTVLEPTIQVLDPAETELVPDDSAQFTDSILYMESQLRQAVPNDENIHVGHTAAMDLVDYQLDPARQALARPRQRILIADAVGLGKTLEAGVLVSELIARGRGRRILVLAVKSMLTQFQKEFWNRFTIPLTRLDSIGIQRVRSRIPTNHNPFYYYDKAIISIDTLKQDAEYRTYLEQASWDIIVIDEAHNVADRGTASQRNRLAKLLARRSDTLIMLSATPHDGKPRSFASLVNMLDATAITNPDNFTKEDFRPGLVIRRFKKDVQDQVRDAFRDRQVFPQGFPASAAEEVAYDALLAVRIAGRRPEAATRDLFAVTLEKALFSSPAACIETVDERIRRREREISNGEDASPRRTEIASLTALRDSLVRIGPSDYSKYQALLDAIQGGQPFNWRPTETTDRLVIFTERIATLNWLNDRLATDLMLKPGQVETLHGGMSDVEQQRVVDDFGNTQRPVRLLLCSDVASEGINLHYQCHRLIHFDMPWSLMVFQQRNGRVDRYGQTATPQIVYLVTESANPTIRGDTRILEVLMAKDEQAYRNIGDPSVFMDVHDIDEEEEITRKAVARGESDTDFDQRWTPKTNEGESLLAMFLQPEGDEGERPPAAMPPPPLSLFQSELDYCRGGLASTPGRGCRERQCGRCIRWNGPPALRGRPGVRDTHPGCARGPGNPLRLPAAGGAPGQPPLRSDHQPTAHVRGHHREPARGIGVAVRALPVAPESRCRVAERPGVGRLRSLRSADSLRRARPRAGPGRFRLLRPGSEPEEPSSRLRMDRRLLPRCGVFGADSFRDPAPVHRSRAPRCPQPPAALGRGRTLDTPSGGRRSRASVLRGTP